MSVADVQRRLRALDYDLGRRGPAGDGIDGEFGTLSQEAALAALVTGARAPLGAPSPPGGPSVPSDWMPDASLTGIVVHWTAGAHRASAFDRAHYHLLIEGDGRLVRGIPSIASNGLPRVKRGYAAHTRNCNTGFVGIALCCMAGARERPFDPGTAPMTRVQWDALPEMLAALCRRYAVPVSPKTLLSHAEVQANLGIAQRGKWDIARLAFDPAVIGARACGDILRARTAERLRAHPRPSPALHRTDP